MIRLPVRDIPADSVVARSLPNPNKPAEPLLKAGTRLNARVLKMLPSIDVRSLWIHQAGTESLNSLISEETLALCGEMLQSAADTVAQAAKGPPSPNRIQHLEDRVIDYVQVLLQGPKVFHLYDDFQLDRHEISFHGAAVCRLAMLIGAEVGLMQGDVESLVAKGVQNLLPCAVACLLHDIGKAVQPAELRDKEPWDLSMRETEEIRNHTVEGAKWLRHRLPDAAVRVPLLHHRFADGEGFPGDALLRQQEVDGADWLDEPEFWQAACLANAFCDMLQKQDYGTCEALEELFCARRHQFTLPLLNALARVVPAFPPGVPIRLGSGHGGVVTEFDPDHPFQPTLLLMTDPKGNALPSGQRVALSLTSYPHLRVESCMGRPVEHLQPDVSHAPWEGMQ